MKKEITFDNFVLLCDRFEKAYFKCGAWWPTIEEIKENIQPKAEQNLEFMIWISETADDPINEEQKESKKYLNDLINQTIVFLD